MDIFLCIFSDSIWLWLLEFFIAVVFVWAIRYDIIAHIKGWAIVTRGGVSWGILLSFWAIAIILIEIIISSNLINDHKVIVGLLNLGIFIYLIFYSSYFTNKVVGWSQRLKDKKYPRY